MVDIARVGFSADTSELANAKASLEALVPAARKVEQATVAVAKADVSAAKAALAKARASDVATKEDIAGAAGALKKAQAVLALAQAEEQAAIAIRTTNAAVQSQNAVMAAAVGQAGQYDAHLATWHAANGRLKGGIDQVGQSMKFNAREGLNFSRQFADIGVTAAMGMNPLMIAIQQGPQLFDILQEKAMATGTSIGAVFRAAGAAIWTALAPLLPLILGIAAVVGTIAAAFALGTRAINDGNKSVIDGMGLTEKQLERVKKAGVDTGVTIGDTFKAFFQVIGDRLQKAFDGPLKWLSDAWSATLDFITKYGSMAIEFIVGGFVGAVYAIRASWKMLPGAIGDVAMMAANAVVNASEWMINKAIDGINKIIAGAKMLATVIPAFSAANALGSLDHVSFGDVANPFAGQAAEFGSAIASGFRQGLAESKGMLSAFWADVAAQARDNARARIRAAAGDAGAGGAKSGGKTDGEKFEDIVAGGERDILEQQARERAAGLTMTAEAAAKLEYQTKLLNEAQQKGIELTDGQRTVLDELAGAYARAKVAADNAVFLQDILKGSDQGLAALQQEINMIGLYGRELARATELARLLGEARQKGMTPEAIAAAMPEFNNRADQYANGAGQLANGKFMENMRVQNAERLIALEQERAAIGLSADEANRLRIENELLAQARQQNIDLTPADIAAIQGVAKEQAGLESQIRKTREILDFTRDGLRGFFADMKSGLQQGKGFWESFGNAIMNVLNKISDKLMDGVLDQIMSAIGGSAKGGKGGGGGWIATAASWLSNIFAPSALGNVFGHDGVQRYAKGGSFTNSVVTAATGFQHGSGLGVMGEAGPEAVMPLTRGPDGSLGVQAHGGGGSQPQRVIVELRAGPTGGMWMEIEAVAQDKAVEVVQVGLSEYDAILPVRVDQIASEPRVK